MKTIQDSNWSLVRKLYRKNFLEDATAGSSIPRKIHQIWLGGELPLVYRMFARSWQKYNPSWEYKLWTDTDAKDYCMVNRKQFDDSKNNGQKSDIFRYEILADEGGVYVDVDFECLRPLDGIVKGDFFSSYAWDKEMVLYIGMIGSAPMHDIILNCIESMGNIYIGNDPMSIMRSTGPYYFTQCFLDCVDEETRGVIVFPTDYFYPLPNKERNTQTPYRFVKENSYAIHHWSVSWAK